MLSLNKVLPYNNCVVRENDLTMDYTDFLFFLIQEIRVIRGLKNLVWLRCVMHHVLHL
jgi:hypothetical protein